MRVCALVSSETTAKTNKAAWNGIGQLQQVIFCRVELVTPYLTLPRAARRLAAACPATNGDGSKETDVVTPYCIGGSARV